MKIWMNWLFVVGFNLEWVFMVIDDDSIVDLKYFFYEFIVLWLVWMGVILCNFGGILIDGSVVFFLYIFVWKEKLVFSYSCSFFLFFIDWVYNLWIGFWMWSVVGEYGWGDMKWNGLVVV